MLREAVNAQIKAHKRSLAERYLAGNAAPEEHRMAVLKAEMVFEDFFESDAEDVRAIIDAEHERDSTD